MDTPSRGIANTSDSRNALSEVELLVVKLRPRELETGTHSYFGPQATEKKS